MEELRPPKPQLTVPLASGDAAVIKKSSNDDAEKNLGLKVQANVCNIRHPGALKDKVETWMSKEKQQPVTGEGSVAELHAAAVDERACSAPLEELENGMGTTDFYLTRRLGVVRSIPKVFAAVRRGSAAAASVARRHGWGTGAGTSAPRGSGGAAAGP